jgi:hypothetical protein
MDNISAFLAVIGKAIRDIEVICREKKSDYWDTLGAIVMDRNFIEMTVAEMIDPEVKWQAAIAAVLAKSEKKMTRLQNVEIAEYAIELKGACKFLLDRYGADRPR